MILYLIWERSRIDYITEEQYKAKCEQLEKAIALNCLMQAEDESEEDEANPRIVNTWIDLYYKIG